MDKLAQVKNNEESLKTYIDFVVEPVIKILVEIKLLSDDPVNSVWQSYDFASLTEQSPYLQDKWLVKLSDVSCCTLLWYVIQIAPSVDLFVVHCAIPPVNLIFPLHFWNTHMLLTAWKCNNRDCMEFL